MKAETVVWRISKSGRLVRLSIASNGNRWVGHYIDERGEVLKPAHKNVVTLSTEFVMSHARRTTIQP